MRAVLSEVVMNDVPVIMESEVEVNNYKDYYPLLNCDHFDVVTTYYKGHELSIFVDDEGLLKPNYGRRVENCNEPLFGNMVVLGGVDEEGNTLPLPDELSVLDISNMIKPIEYMTRG